MSEAEQLLDVRQAADHAGVSTKTIRRAIAEGKLAASTVKGRRGTEWRVAIEDLDRMYGEAAPKPIVRSPMDDLRQELEAVRLALAEQTAAYERLERERAEQTAAQSRTIDELRAEVRDSRAQMHQLQEQILRALPEPKKPWWRFGNRQ